MSDAAAASTPIGDRYGRAAQPRSRLGAVAVAATLGAAFLAWVVWAGLGAGDPQPSGQVVGFDVRGPEQLEVRLVLSGPTGRVTCVVQALGRGQEVVGVTDAGAAVRGGRQVRTTVVVRTRTRALSARVDACST